MKAIDVIREIYITENELASFLEIDPKRLRDLRSFHTQGKEKFIDFIKPSGKQVLYALEDVIEYLKNCPRLFFGVNENKDKRYMKES